MKIRPLGKLLLVKPIKEPQTAKNGILIIPNENSTMIIVEVIEVGPGASQHLLHSKVMVCRYDLKKTINEDEMLIDVDNVLAIIEE